MVESKNINNIQKFNGLKAFKSRKTEEFYEGWDRIFGKREDAVEKEGKNPS